MSKIKILDESLINKIAAGEVIERPASVVKELVENSIDAESTKIFVDIEDGGKNLIKVSDNGTGMSKEDAAIAFERHSTSKIKDINDLFSIKSLGFRGEALASIASVSELEVKTKFIHNKKNLSIIKMNTSITNIDNAAKCPRIYFIVSACLLAIYVLISAIMFDWLFACLPSLVKGCQCAILFFLGV